MAWILWLFSPIVLYFGPTYFSEATTTACWLAGWYALLEWRESRRLGWLAAVAFFLMGCHHAAAHRRGIRDSDGRRNSLGRGAATSLARFRPRARGRVGRH